MNAIGNKRATENHVPADTETATLLWRKGGAVFHALLLRRAGRPAGGQAFSWLPSELAAREGRVNRDYRCLTADAPSRKPARYPASIYYGPVSSSADRQSFPLMANLSCTMSFLSTFSAHCTLCSGSTGIGVVDLPFAGWSFS